MLRRLAACSIAAVLATAAYGAAASLDITGDAVSASSADPRVDCTVSSDDVTYSYAGANVSSVQVTNLPAACQGGEVWLTLTGTGGVKVSGAGPILAPGATASFDVPDVAASSVLGYSIAVVR